MATRNILESNERLYKKSKTVKEITPRIITLLDDMAETMYEANGVGLAAPQVGVLKNVVIVDVGDGLIELINPEIISSSGKQIGDEGCLSVPGESAVVVRPQKVTVHATDRNGKGFDITGEDLLARALCHEIDHLSGILYTDIAVAQSMEDLSEEEIKFYIGEK